MFGSNPSIVAICADLASNGIADFQRNIRFGTDWFSVGRSVFLHITSAEWLERNLEEDFDGPTVVVTHNLPSRSGVAIRYADDLLSAAFASDLDRLMGKAMLWIHGHTHNSFDHALNGTRVLCNPRWLL